MITNDAYKIKVGSSEADRVYKGSNLIWDSGNSHTYLSGSGLSDYADLDSTQRYTGTGQLADSQYYGNYVAGFSIIGDTITNIPEYCFEFARFINPPSLGLTITGIGSKAFFNAIATHPNSPQQTLTIPASVKDIGDEAFLSTNMTGIDFSLDKDSDLTGIGIGAFAFSLSLTSIRLPTGLNTLGNTGFAGCTGLEVIRMMSDNPPTHDPLFPAFSGVNANAKVYVKLSASGNWGSTFGGLDVEPIIVQDTFQLTLSEAPSTTDTFAFTFNQIASGSLGYKWESDESAAGEANKYTCEKQSVNVEGTTANTWRIEQSSYLNPRYLVDPRSASANAATPFDVASGDWIRGEEDGAGGITYLESGITLNFQNVAYSDSVATGILTN